MTYDGVPRVVRCPHCGVERWAGDGPCSSCGKYMRLLTEDIPRRAEDPQHSHPYQDMCTVHCPAYSFW